MAEKNPATQRQTAVTAYLSLHGGQFEYSMAEEIPAAQRQTAVTAYLSLHGGQFDSTRWQKRILHLKDKQR